MTNGKVMHKWHVIVLWRCHNSYLTMINDGSCNSIILTSELDA